MTKKIFLGLLISLFSLVFVTQHDFYVVNASSSCAECTEEKLCELHNLKVEDNVNLDNDNDVDTNGKPIEIVDDDNDEGITLLGNDDNNGVETNSKPIEIVDDDNDEGITLLGGNEEIHEND